MKILFPILFWCTLLKKESKRRQKRSVLISVLLLYRVGDIVRILWVLIPFLWLSEFPCSMLKSPRELVTVLLQRLLVLFFIYYLYVFVIKLMSNCVLFSKLIQGSLNEYYLGPSETKCCSKQRCSKGHCPK